MSNENIDIAENSLKINDNFTKNELAFIEPLNIYLINKHSAKGTISYRGHFVRYEVNIGQTFPNDELILQFEVRDKENIEKGCHNFVSISNIMIPVKYKRQHIATEIILLMTHVANYDLGIYFYIHEVVNDGWRKNLIRMGGIEEDDGDIYISYKKWKKNFPNIE